MFLPPDQVPWLGLALVAGNRFPCFHCFRGGKGVAAYLGFAGFLAPWAAVLAAALWVVVFSVVRVPFVASFYMIAPSRRERDWLPGRRRAPPLRWRRRSS
jgi:glycerol-3-phosphate acyltransferase PlsY